MKPDKEAECEKCGSMMDDFRETRPWNTFCGVGNDQVHIRTEMKDIFFCHSCQELKYVPVEK